MKSWSEKKQMVFMVIGAITLIMAVLGATYAYFQAQGGVETNIDANIQTATTDNLSFQVGGSINLTANQEDFGQGLGNKSGETYARATLTANNATNNATRYYYIYLDITANDLVYTIDENTPELILSITGPEGEVTQIDGLKYVTVGEVSGFDITERQEIIPLADNYEITSTGTITQEWIITITLINLNSDQQANTGKVFNASLIVQEEKTDKVLFADYIKSLYTVDGENNLYLHDADLANGANDNSLRYAGGNYKIADQYADTYTAINNDLIKFYCDGTEELVYTSCYNKEYYYTLSYDTNNTQYLKYKEVYKQAIADGYLVPNVNNYVCFGSNEEECPEDNLYRIIGVFGDQVKLIKADLATIEQLGTNGFYQKYVHPNVQVSYEVDLTKSAYYLGDQVKSAPYYVFYAGISSNSYDKSEFNTINLNTNYINSLGTLWISKISDATWYIGGGKLEKIGWGTDAQTTYSYEVGENKAKDGDIYICWNGGDYDKNCIAENTEYQTKIALPYVSDYMYAASPEAWTKPGYTRSDLTDKDGNYGVMYDYRSESENDWLYLGVDYFTISRITNYSNATSGVSVDADGSINAGLTYAGLYYGVLLLFYLKSELEYVGGTGTGSDPFRID